MNEITCSLVTRMSFIFAMSLCLAHMCVGNMFRIFHALWDDLACYVGMTHDTRDETEPLNGMFED